MRFLLVVHLGHAERIPKIPPPTVARVHVEQLITIPFIAGRVLVAELARLENGGLNNSEPDRRVLMRFACAIL